MAVTGDMLKRLNTLNLSEKQMDGVLSILADATAKRSGRRQREVSMFTQDEFDKVFWPAYPNKIGKGDALPAFDKARKKVDLDTIMTGLRSYIANKPHDRPWCNPSTWLNQERWTDQPADTASGQIAPESPENWKKRLTWARDKGVWSTEQYGPAPGKPGCRVPAELLMAGDGNGWIEYADWKARQRENA